MPKLIINESGNKKEWIHDCLEDEISIGRHEENLIVLPKNGISRQHAKIIKEGDNFFVIDLGSENGTLLNGVLIPTKEKHLLRNNDLITIDVFNLRFHTTDEVVEKSYNEEITDSDILEVKLLKKVLRALDTETVPSFEVLNGSEEGKKVFLTDDITEIILGRDSSCDFSINEFAISRRHARVSKRWGGIVVRDLESKNGTFVNNRRIVEEFLHDGDRIALGTILLLFRNPQEINFSQISEKVAPKNSPAQVNPKDILPTDEGSSDKSLSDENLVEEIEEIEEPNQPEPNPNEEISLYPEKQKKPRYPIAAPKKSFFKQMAPVEIGMIGLGALVLIFALITIVNLMFE